MTAQPHAAEPSAVNLPNALTLLRVAMVPAFAWVFLSQPQSAAWRYTALAIFALAQITDVVDGRIARARHLVTRFGKLVDPIADKLLTGMAFVALSLVSELSWWVTGVILLREWGVTVLRFAMLRFGVISANRGGKLKAVIQTVAILLLLLPFRDWPSWASITTQWLAWLVVALAVALTVLTGADYVREAVRLRRRASESRGAGD